jgi:peroxiredoxin
VNLCSVLSRFMHAFCRPALFVHRHSKSDLSGNRFVQTVDHVVVGRRAEPTKSDSAIWIFGDAFNNTLYINSIHNMMRVVSFALLLTTLLVCCSNADKRVENQARPGLPPLEIQLNDGSKVSVQKLPGKVALILFFPDCDHCQREAAQIQKNIAGFKDYTLYFISSASFEDINHFASTYQLADYKNVVFARTESKNVLDVFGPIETPTIYLYDKNGDLIESFSGEVAIEVVLKYI